MYVMSDLRIEEDIADIVDEEALIKFRKLQPKAIPESLETGVSTNGIN
jgi:hypothetical protein